MPDTLDLRDRSTQFRRLNDTAFDILVIGGGITGAGVARDAALRGYEVALVDAADFGAGTSSRSTKLIHAGLRYLAQGRVGLVREAARERAILARIAPHLAQPVRMVVTARSWLERQKIRLGVAAFERLGRVPTAQRHEVWTRAELAQAEPVLNTERLSGAVAYAEYLTDDAKLVLANVRSAASAGAVVLNYAGVQKIVFEAGQAPRALIADGLEAGRSDRSPAAAVRARVIVNAAGPWVDPVRQLEQHDAGRKLVLTRGIHLVFGRERLPVGRAIMMKTPDNRSAFTVPRGVHVYVGTTDTFYPSPDVWPSIEAADIDYLLQAANLTFDGVALERSDVRSMWAGLRPLVADAGKSPSEISRKDEMWTGPEGVITIAGGKLTAYRRMAERAVDACAARLGTARPCSSHEHVLPGGDRPPETIGPALEKAGAAADVAARLVQLYGSAAVQVWQDGGGVAAEVRYAVASEGAVRLEDWWYRRSARAWFDPGDRGGALEEGADEMGRLIGWSADEKRRQIDAVGDRMKSDLHGLDG